MGRICKTKAGLAGCGAADTQEREREREGGRCKEEIKKKKVQEWEGSNRLDGWLV